jgi:hypothetical protein
VPGKLRLFLEEEDPGSWVVGGSEVMQSDGDGEGGGAKTDADEVEGLGGGWWREIGMRVGLVGGGEGEIGHLEGRQNIFSVDGRWVHDFRGSADS